MEEIKKVLIYYDIKNAKDLNNVLNEYFKQREELHQCSNCFEKCVRESDVYCCYCGKYQGDY